MGQNMIQMQVAVKRILRLFSQELRDLRKFLGQLRNEQKNFHTKVFENILNKEADEHKLYNKTLPNMSEGIREIKEMLSTHISNYESRERVQDEQIQRLSGRIREIEQSRTTT